MCREVTWLPPRAAKTVLAVWLLMGAGCASLPTSWPTWLGGKKPDAAGGAAGAVDAAVMRGSGLEKEKTGHPLEQDLDAADRLFQQQQYSAARAIYHRVATSKKIPPQLVERGVFGEAECYFQDGNFRAAQPLYKKLIGPEFRYGRHQDDSARRLFDIAHYWLDDTRKQMEAYAEKNEGKRWFVMPASFVHFTKDKPLFDMEGNALASLEDIRLFDINGPMGEKALFYIATVKFFKEDWRDADYYYSQLFEHHPNSKWAPKAIKQSIICKQMMTGGSAYDGRALEDARKLIIEVARGYPELRQTDEEFLKRQLVSIQRQQADKDYNIAEFYRRTGHPGSAYFYYELVRRRYPGTDYATRAEERMDKLRGRVEKEQTQEAARQEAAARQEGRVPSPPAADAPTQQRPATLPQGILSGSDNK